MIHIFLIFLSLLLTPCHSYKFETCCFDEKTNTNSSNSSIRLLSCPLNFVIKLRTAIFHTGNGCSTSLCQRRLNKHYLACNNQRTCSISIKCISMDSSMCPGLNKDITHAQHLIVDYDCILFEPEPPLVALNRLQTKQINQSQLDDQENIVLFSAKVNIESPPGEALNDSINTPTNLSEDERAWKEFILKQYLHGKLPAINGERPIIIQQPRSLFSDILRTVIILIVFTIVLLVLILVGFFLYKRLKFVHQRKFFGHHKEQHHPKHQPFPADEAYDNLKTSAAGSTTDSGTATDV